MMSTKTTPPVAMVPSTQPRLHSKQMWELTQGREKGEYSDRREQRGLWVNTTTTTTATTRKSTHFFCCVMFIWTIRQCRLNSKTETSLCDLLYEGVLSHFQNKSFAFLSVLRKRETGKEDWTPHPYECHVYHMFGNHKVRPFSSIL